MTLIPALAGLKHNKPLVTGDEKILLIGAAGQIGQHIKPLLEGLYRGKVISVARNADPKESIESLDFTKTDDLLALIKKHNVKVVINMAAYLSSRAEGHPHEAREVNFEAVKRMVEGCEKLGVRQIFTPGTIAVYGPDAERYATMNSLTNPSGVYGRSKVELENFMRDWNAKGHTTFVTGMRLGGVLTCKMPPSEGTAMEFDKMLVAAAYQQATGNIYPPLASYYDQDGKYHPKIPATTKMPFIHVDDAAREIVRYLHSVERSDPDASRHHLASFTMDMQQFQTWLAKRTDNRFQCVYDENSTTGPRARFASEWPSGVDMSTGQQWGYDPQMCMNANQAVYHCFSSVLESQMPIGRHRQ